MGVIGVVSDWAHKVFGIEKNLPTEIYDCGCVENANYYKNIAVASAINLIANTVSLAEFKVYKNEREDRSDEYYIFNIEANKNQSAKDLWKETVKDMILDKYPIVLKQDDGLYKIKSCEKKEFAFKPNIYKNIVVGNYEIKNTFLESDVFDFKLNTNDINSSLSMLYNDFDQLINTSQSIYTKNNGVRGTLEVPTNYTQGKGKEEVEKLLKNSFKAWTEPGKIPIIPLANGFKYNDLTNSTYKNSSDSRDIRNLIDDVFDFVAVSFRIPPQLLKGSVADSDKLWSSYITLCIKPIITVIENEINRKYFKKQGFMNGDYVRIDISGIKQNDLIEIANAIDILTRNGVNTMNDNLVLLGKSKVGDELGDKRFITLNLAELGGEKKDEK